MKKHFFVLVIAAAVMGLEVCALSAEPPIPKAPEQLNASSTATPVEASGDSGESTVDAGEVTEFAEPSRSPADAYNQMDAAFTKYVDLSVLSQAVAGPGASLLTDVALGLAEGERVLVRKHRAGLTADELMARAAKLAVRLADKPTLERITAVAKAHSKPHWAKLVAEAKEFGGVSRDIPSPIVSLATINAQAVALIDTVRQACDLAGLTGHKGELQALKKDLLTSDVDAQVKTYLTNMIDACLKGLPEKPSNADTLLREFASDSRQRLFGWGAVKVELLINGRALPFDNEAGRAYTEIDFPRTDFKEIHFPQYGMEYAIRVTNQRLRRIVIDISVDGISVMTRKPAAKRIEGYIIPPGASYTIKGWRLNDDSVSAFTVTRPAESVALKQGGLQVGSLAITAFEEYEPLRISAPSQGWPDLLPGLPRGGVPVSATPLGRPAGTGAGVEMGSKVNRVPFRLGHWLGKLYIKYDVLDTHNTPMSVIE